MDKSIKGTSLPTKLVLNQLLKVWASAPTTSSLLPLTQRVPIVSLTTTSHHTAVTGSIITVHNRCHVFCGPQAQNNPPGHVREVSTLLSLHRSPLCCAASPPVSPSPSATSGNARAR